MSQQVFDILERVKQVVDESSGQKFLRIAQQYYESRNIGYLCLNLPNKIKDNYHMCYSHDYEWEKHYADGGIAYINQEYGHNINRITPVDWSNIDHLPKEERKFFGLVRGSGVGGQGLSFTVRGSCGEMAIFSINTNHSEKDWLAFKTRYIGDLQVIATYFHDRILKFLNVDQNVVEVLLSSRERECLEWCAAGKSYWETSVILDISERTVNFHMTSARRKLNALTNAHAVVKAIAKGLIRCEDIGLY